MPRPCKRRRVCAMPGCARFGPMPLADEQAVVAMAVDEFEAIRLIDLEGLTQEECAARMQVARATVQAMYASARRKLATCLVLQRELRIEGGDYVLCEGSAGCAGDCGGCRRARMKGADQP